MKFPWTKKTIRAWEQEFRVHILDPDGFDRRDPDLMERRFTREEFYKRLMRCTIVTDPYRWNE